MNLHGRMEENSVLTVVIPAYNAENYIRDTIISVVQQITDFKFEIILIDDNSTDRTYQIGKSLENEIINLKIFKNSENQGMSTNQLLCIQRSKSKYTAYLDSDDMYVDPYFLQKQFDFLEKNQNVMVVFSNYWIFEEQSNKEFPKHHFQNKPPEIFDLHSFFQKTIPICNSTMVFRSYLNQEIPTWYTEYFQFDWLLHIFHGLHGDFGYNDFIGTKYRVHKNNATNIKNAEKKFLDGIYLVLNSHEYVPSEYRKYFISPLWEMNQLSFFYLRYRKFRKFIFWYYRWLKAVSIPNINFRDQFWYFRKALFNR